MSQKEFKRLKDYPLDEWMEAADGCEFCGAKYQVKVTWVDESGDFGDVETRIEHDLSCPEVLNSLMGVYCIEDQDIAGWEWSDRKITIVGRKWLALKSRANIGPCLSCGKLIVGVPLILWPKDGEVEADFCFKCGKELGILDQLLGGRT